ncbi:MAG TPA: TRAP transporter large permease [Syntrophorhabdaceae bacterium]|nr:TRAP transporter large permease [Syntrophorhabdaceae bacterium]HOT42667.1 TRAP transporter large permease [Syntrophorhabdaceae bacterium]HQE80978.1 TRAP transporter large permease [Syntrophorhabdaceae bacterium]HQH44001.1 TRAP transporter large permease [Syntrophorhabdaceae bacterium]HQK47149.1 TRAP transporter large permease [Syntrophorhabdaceae bacterium]
MSEMQIGIYMIVLLLILFLTGLEMAYCMILAGFLGFWYLMGFLPAANLIIKDFFDTFTTYSYTVIPLFILMGEFASHSNIAKRLYSGAHKWFGHIPGGLAMTTIVGATAFKAMCGSTLATVGTFSNLALPEMDRYRYSKELSTGTIASVSTLGMILPPSTVLIIYGLEVEQSIGRLFIAGIVPSILIALLMMIVVTGWVMIRPEIAPRADKSSWKERLAAIPEALLILIVFGIVIGGMITGFFSPTEAGTIGTVAIFILALVRKEVNKVMFINSIKASLKTSIMVLMLIAGSNIFGHFLAITEIPMQAAEWASGLPLSGTLIMIVIIIIYLLGGSIMDDLAFMVLATPIFFPTAIKLGYDPIWFGILICVTLMIGGLIPPIAIYVFILGNITGLPFKTIYKGVLPFLLSLVLALIILFVFPDIALWLPNLLMGKG